MKTLAKPAAKKPAAKGRSARPASRAVRLAPPPGRKASEIADLLPPPSKNFDAEFVASVVACRSDR